MTWADFYLICFAVGFSFSLLSFLAGGLRWHLHLPHFSHLHLASHVPVGPGAAPGAHASASPANAGKIVTHAQATPISPFNFITITAFLAWFGGTGYLLTRYSGLWLLSGLSLAVFSGLVGGGIVFLFLSRVLIAQEESMDPADYEMVGVLGRISVPIREKGTGEIIYSQAGTRRTCGARCENGDAAGKGSEVVVTRYEKGIAYVRRWTEMAGEDSPSDVSHENQGPR
jgi:membrane protein implicated in regulation of membrane protease activity